MVLAMLDEDEYRKAYALYGQGMRTREGTRAERFQALLAYYFQITGEMETEPNAVMHHRIAQYGPPCKNCGKPYRTPQASFCGACGHKRHTDQQR